MSVTLQGAERTYRIDCTRTNALVRVEEETGRSFLSAINALDSDDPDPELARQFLGAVLVDPDEASAEQVAVILDDIGGPAVIAAAAAGIA